MVLPRKDLITFKENKILKQLKFFWWWLGLDKENILARFRVDVAPSYSLLFLDIIEWNKWKLYLSSLLEDVIFFNKYFCFKTIFIDFYYNYENTF